MSTKPKRRERSICIRCTERDALEFPAGHGAQLCGVCEDLQDREHVQWEAEQRAKAALGVGESISHFADGVLQFRVRQRFVAFELDLRDHLQGRRGAEGDYKLIRSGRREFANNLVVDFP